MAYQVLARKWRPQRFDDVVGQQAVTRTLRNAIGSGRIAHAFVFAGPRGCGKTTTARILARALNCIHGPTADPCGECDACVEIAQGRDIDVLEIDAASHTQVDNIREVILSGLSVAPVRDRYKIFIIDEVHQLSSHSFNALLKSIEEPPAHVVFMMATTELHKIPDTILSRSQVFEFKTIPTRSIVAQLRRIADAEGIDVSDAALTLIARAAEGSMRDAQSALDQVIAFAGQTIAVDDVATVLGLVGRDLLIDVVQAVVDEDGPRAFALADRAVESGHDLKLVCRELSRVVRDMMLLSVDPARAGDGELADAERQRLTELGARFSREDLMRAFDLLARAEQEIRTVSHPRYYFEMVLLRWMHLRKLVPLADLIEQLGSAAGPSPRGSGPTARGNASTIAGSRATSPRAPAPAGPAAGPTPPGGHVAATKSQTARASGHTAPPSAHVAPTTSPLAPTTGRVAPTSGRIAPASDHPAPTGSHIAPTSGHLAATTSPLASTSLALKDALLAEIRAGKPFFYNTVVAQAQRIEVADERVTFTFLPAHRALREQFEQSRGWLESAAERVAGRRILVEAIQSASAADGAASAAPQAAPADEGAKRDLKAEAMTSSAVQAVLDVFPAEISDVEEMK
jgi:DNA polymerase III subunit gamma/tau